MSTEAEAEVQALPGAGKRYLTCPSDQVGQGGKPQHDSYFRAIKWCNEQNKRALDHPFVVVDTWVPAQVADDE